MDAVPIVVPLSPVAGLEAPVEPGWGGDVKGFEFPHPDAPQ